MVLGVEQTVSISITKGFCLTCAKQFLLHFCDTINPLKTWLEPGEVQLSSLTKILKYFHCFNLIRLSVGRGIFSHRRSFLWKLIRCAITRHLLHSLLKLTPHITQLSSSDAVTSCIYSFISFYTFENRIFFVF